MRIGMAGDRLYPRSFQRYPKRAWTAPIATVAIHVGFSKHHLLKLFGTQKSTTNTVKPSANIAPITTKAMPPRVSGCVETCPVLGGDNRFLDPWPTEIPNITNSWNNAVLEIRRWQDCASNLNTKRITCIPRCALPPLSQIALGVHKTQLVRATDSQRTELGHPSRINGWRATVRWQRLDQIILREGKPVYPQSPPRRHCNAPNSHVTRKSGVHWQHYMCLGAIGLSVFSSGVDFHTKTSAVHRTLRGVPVPHHVL
mmetsp:Transcript_47007/g.124498  ORF Transcript_47007/g.124498 Transcript_47007/m.124498 type:complete len:256 (-) Transcript_47007:1241-2008(-)